MKKIVIKTDGETLDTLLPRPALPATHKARQKNCNSRKATGSTAKQRHETYKACQLESTKQKQRVGGPLSTMQKLFSCLYFGFGLSQCATARCLGLGDRPNMPGHPRTSKVRKHWLDAGFILPTTGQKKRIA